MKKKRKMTYFKFFPKDLKLRGFQYKLGLNEDIIEFNLNPVCGPGGLYYTDIHNLENFSGYGEMIELLKFLQIHLSLRLKICRVLNINLQELRLLIL